MVWQSLHAVAVVMGAYGAATLAIFLIGCGRLAARPMVTDRCSQDWL
jgi:hypothetical protein